MIASDGHVTVEHDSGVVARHTLVAPAEVSLIDQHYGGPRRSPARAVRPRSRPEKQFLALGPTAEDVELMRTIAWDQCREMARHLDFTVDTGIQVYLCDPHSPWRRGSNEHPPPRGAVN